ncbi:MULTISPECIES: hypothetical protein [Streptomyces]|uniref:Uncharacterized protein n=1 Tax=Streptomyces cacaoi TaxID=1898 RepID=A0A4Y3R755_STRCI|nr:MULTISPECIES: hypothetical protein [Streptomyces]NNG85569.1 hypothetical protein [Streptomyces cacaoi]GEB53199.1 hypothetical protein SCA03_57500 [Streptomyces cacaoi]
MLPLALRAVARWPASRWGASAGAAVLTFLAVGLPTAVVPNPLFSRSVPTPWWGYPSLALTAVLAGLLLATYVRRAPAGPDAAGPGDASAPAGTGPGDGSAGGVDGAEGRRSSRAGAVGAVLGFFAVGCPVCNKLVLLALGTSGALSIWQPLQPLLAVVSVALLAVATVRRLAGEVACPVARA